MSRRVGGVPDDHDESKLPKWARMRLDALRRQVAQLRVDAVDEDDLPADVRVLIKRQTRDEETGVLRRTAIPLRDDDIVVMQVTGGEMWIELRKFGARRRVGITGMARWDPIAQDRPDIAILPAQKRGIALKIVDGGTRASEAAITALLVKLGALDPAHPVVEELIPSVQKNWRGLVTGGMRLAPGFA